MTKIHRADFFPERWLNGTRCLNPEQKGAYITICAMIMAAEGPIKEDYTDLGRAMGCSQRKARAYCRELQDARKISIRGGKIFQKVAEEVVKSARKRIEDAANAGQKSAESRKKTSKTATSSSTPVPQTVGTNNTTKSRNIDSLSNERDTPKAPERNPPISPDQSFIQFMQTYPASHLGDPMKVQRAWAGAVQIATRKEILDGLTRYLACRQVANGYISQAVHWLGNRRWAEKYEPAGTAVAAGPTARKGFAAKHDAIQRGLAADCDA